MRVAGWTAALVILLSAAAPAADAPDPARLAAMAYLDSLAEARLAARVEAVKAIRTRAEAAHRQAEVRKKILDLIGGPPERSAPLKAQVTGAHAGDGFRLENVIYESLPGYRVTANVYIPAGKGPFPAVVISPGHAPSGKASDYPFAVSFARAGFVVLSYDIVGEGERLQTYDPDLNASRLERPTGEHSLAAYQSLLVGEPVVRFFVNDVLRGIDYLATRKDVDVSRIGAFGCSGGGAVTAYATALDPRIKAAASACFVTTMHQLLSTIGPQEAEQSTPGFTAAGLDLADWVELAAPRPYAIVSTTEDMFPFEGARQVNNEAERFWTLFGAGNKLHWITGPGRHGALQPIALDIVGFFAKYLNKGGGKPVFSPARPVRPQDLLVTSTGQLSTSFGGETIQTMIAARAKSIAAPPLVLKNAESEGPAYERLRRDIREIAKVSAEPGSAPPATEILKTEIRSGYRAETIRFAPKQGPAFEGLLAVPNAPLIGRMIYLVRNPFDKTSQARWEPFINRGYEVLVLEPVGGTGEEAKASVLGDYSLFALRAMLVDRTITGMRIDQAIEAANWFLRRPGEHLAKVLYGVGVLGPVALHVAVLDSRFTDVAVSGAQLSYRMSADTPVTRNLPEIALPGVLAKYDLPDLIAALAPRPVMAIDPVDAAGRSLRQEEFEKLIASTRQSDSALGLKERVQWLPYEPRAKE
jgi:hypothetical protein